MRGKKCEQCAFVTEGDITPHHMFTGHRGTILGTIVERGWTGRYTFEPDLLPPVPRPPAQSSLQECDTCGRQSTPAGIGSHQKATGHTGRTPVWS